MLLYITTSEDKKDGEGHFTFKEVMYLIKPPDSRVAKGVKNLWTAKVSGPKKQCIFGNYA